MEKVWEELKKIELHAEQIRIEAQNRAKEITNLANQEAEKLVANSKVYAEEEAQRLNQLAVTEANEKSEMQLKTAQENTDELRRAAEKRMKHAEDVILKAVVGNSEI